MRNHLDAVVVIEKPLSIQLSELPDDDEEKIEINKLIKEQRIINAPIYELYIINEDDEDEMFLKSAIIVENVRFFMKFIWRPWDTISNETQSNEIFVETRLESRLNLYFDVRKCLLSETQIKRIKHILADGWRLRNQLDEIAKKQENQIQTNVDDDSEALAVEDYEIDELDMAEAIRLKIRLEDYDREMRMLEDPYLRPFTFYLKGNQNEEEVDKLMIQVEEEQYENKIHVVSHTINLNSLQSINSYYAEDETCSKSELIFHQSLKDAIKLAKNGDRIAILPGHYVYESVPFIECDLMIEGITTDESEILIESSAFIDVFIYCPTNLTLKNLTLKCPAKDLVINDDYDSFRTSKKLKKS